MTNYPGSVYVVVAALRAEDLPADSERKSELTNKNKRQKFEFFAEFLAASALRLDLIEVWVLLYTFAFLAMLSLHCCNFGSILPEN